MISIIMETYAKSLNFCRKIVTIQFQYLKRAEEDEVFNKKIINQVDKLNY